MVVSRFGDSAPRSAARTLTEALRLLDEPALARLFVLRPDLAYPTPTDIADLSTQATTTSSVGRSLDALNAWQRLVAEGLAALPDPASVAALAELLRAEPTACAAAVGDLRAQALLWGADDDLHLVRAVRDHLGPYPGGLAAQSPRPLPAERIEDLLAAAGPEARTVVDRLLWSPAGAVSGADRAVTIDTLFGGRTRFSSAATSGCATPQPSRIPAIPNAFHIVRTTIRCG